MLPPDQVGHRHRRRAGAHAERQTLRRGAAFGRSWSLTLALVLGTAAIAPPAEAGDAASVLLGIALGVLVGTSSAPPQQPAPQPQQPQQSMRWIDQQCLPNPNTTVCRSPVLRSMVQRNSELTAAILSHLSGPAADQLRAEIQQQNAQYHAECGAVPVNPDCIYKWERHWDQLYSARLAALSAPTPAPAPRQRPVTPASYPPPTPPSRAVRIEGEITEATIAQFDASILRDPNINTVVLDSPGGVVLASRDLAMRIRRLHLTTVVPANAECASACFMLFAAGERRIASPSARIGIHSASYHGEEDRDTLAVSTLMARQCGVFGVPNAILGMMITQPGGGEVTWLSADELRSMQVEVQ